MSELDFFERPILNSPYERQTRKAVIDDPRNMAVAPFRGGTGNARRRNPAIDAMRTGKDRGVLRRSECLPE